MIETDRHHLETAALTHAGMTGKNNEDRYAIASFLAGEDGSSPVLFAMVADGVGGKQAGELAAEMAVETVLAALKNSDGSDPVATMRTAIEETNRLIHQRAIDEPDTNGMGTTATCAWIDGKKLYTANVGNSRLYWMRAGKLRRITIDHSWVQEAMDLGLLTPAQARKHPNARVITRHLGADSSEPDFRLQLEDGQDSAAMEANQGMELQLHDILLLCSDGLSDVVDDDEIEQVLRDQPMEAALKTLVDKANDNGGPDNITVVGIRAKTPRAAKMAGPSTAAATKVSKSSALTKLSKPAGDRTRANESASDGTSGVKKTSESAAAEDRPRRPAVRLAVYVLSIIVMVVLVVIGWVLLNFYM